VAKATKHRTPTAPIEGALVASEEGDSITAAGTMTTPSEAGDSANFGGEVRWTALAAWQALVPDWIELPIAVDYVARTKAMTSAEALDRICAAVTAGRVRAMERHRFADGWEQANLAAAFWPVAAKRLRIAEDGRTVEWAAGMGWGDDWMLYVRDEDLEALLAQSVPPSKPAGKRGPQRERVMPILRQIYPPDGAVPGDVSTTTVLHQVCKELKQRSPQETNSLPDWHTINRLLGRE
jgi:hypothetical protein